MIIAALVTSVQLLMNAYTYGLYQALGIFIALIVTNCVIIGRAEAYASKNPPLLAALDGFMMGLGFTLVLLVLGGLREIIGMGTLFDGADLLLERGQVTAHRAVPRRCQPAAGNPAPGGFIGLGLMIAGKNAINDWMGRKQSAEKAHCSAGRGCPRDPALSQERAMNNQKRRQILERLRDDNPHPTTELNFKTPFELLIAVLLSAQATDVRSTRPPTSSTWWPTPSGHAGTGVDGVKEYIKTIGLFNTKAENVIKTCAILLERHGGEVPENREALEALPGLAARPPTWCSTPPSAGPPSPSIPISSGFQPHRLCGGQERRSGGGEAAKVVPAESAGRAPLADPARTLHLSGSQTALRFLYHRGLVRVQGKGLPES